MKITLRASWVHSLKEKRMIVKSITKRLTNKFNISVCESEYQDVHQTIVISVVGLAPTQAIASSTMDAIVDLVEENTDAEIMEIVQDMDMFDL